MGRGALKRARVYRRSKAARAWKKRKPRMMGVAAHAVSNQCWYNAFGAPSPNGLSTNVVLERRTMYFAKVEISKQPSSVEQLGQVARDSAKLSGLKICINAANQNTGPTEHVMVHIALVQLKQFNNDNWDNTSFFSTPGGGNAGADKTENFIDFGGQTAVQFQYNCNGINKDKWNVLTHFKRVLAPTSGSSQMNSVLRYDKYFNMRKTRVAWDTITSDNITKPLMILVWYERSHNDSNTTFGGNFKFNINTVSYFRNV